MKYILLILALIALRSPLSAQNLPQLPDTHTVAGMPVNKWAKQKISTFFDAANKKQSKRFSETFSESEIVQYFRLEDINRNRVYSSAWGWFKANPNENYKPEWTSFKIVDAQGIGRTYTIKVAYTKDGVDYANYSMTFGLGVQDNYPEFIPHLGIFKVFMEKL